MTVWELPGRTLDHPRMNSPVPDTGYGSHRPRITLPNQWQMLYFHRVKTTLETQLLRRKGYKIRPRNSKPYWANIKKILELTTDMWQWGPVLSSQACQVLDKKRAKSISTGTAFPYNRWLRCQLISWKMLNKRLLDGHLFFRIWFSMFCKIWLDTNLVHWRERTKSLFIVQNE